MLFIHNIYQISRKLINTTGVMAPDPRGSARDGNQKKITPRVNMVSIVPYSLIHKGHAHRGFKRPVFNVDAGKFAVMVTYRLVQDVWTGNLVVSTRTRHDAEAPVKGASLTGRRYLYEPKLMSRRKQRIEELEDRLAKMESMLGHSQPPASSISVDRGPGDSTDGAFGSPLALTAEADEGGQPQELGHPQPAPISVLQRVSRRLSELQATSSTEPFRSIVGTPLIPQPTEVSLLRESLGDILEEFPFLDIQLFRRQITTWTATSVEASDSVTVWACINALLALLTQTVVDNGSFQELNIFAWVYFKNAYAVFPGLVLHDSGPETLPAMSLMSLFMSYSADARTKSLLLSSTLRMAQTSLLSNGCSCEGTNSHNAEYLQRAYWTAFVLDTELSLCTGIALSLTPADLEFDPPNAVQVLDGAATAIPVPKSPESVFRWRVELALIQQRVRVRLYSRPSFFMSDAELLETIDTLERELQDWGRKIPSELQLWNIHPLVEKSHVIILHLALQNVISMVHWAARRHSNWGAISTEPQEERFIFRLKVSKSKVRLAAQKTLQLLRAPPLGQFPLFWCECLLSDHASKLTILGVTSVTRCQQS